MSSHCSVLSWSVLELTLVDKPRIEVIFLTAHRRPQTVFRTNKEQEDK